MPALDPLSLFRNELQTTDSDPPRTNGIGQVDDGDIEHYGGSSFSPFILGVYT